MENNHLWVNGEQVPTEILEDNPCDDGSGRNCGFQEKQEPGSYKTQHVIPTAYRTVEGDTLESSEKGGVQRKPGDRTDTGSTPTPRITERDERETPRRDGLQIRSPKLGISGTLPSGLSRPLPALRNTSLRPCFGSRKRFKPRLSCSARPGRPCSGFRRQPRQFPRRAFLGICPAIPHQGARIYHLVQRNALSGSSPPSRVRFQHLPRPLISENGLTDFTLIDQPPYRIERRRM